MDPLPTVNHAYAMIVGDESQKDVVTNTSGIGLNSVGLESLAMYSRTGSSSGVSQRFKKHSPLVCDFCKCKGHVKEFCYKIIGYPPDFKSKRKVQGVNSVYATPDTAQKQSDPIQANFSYGLNTNVSLQDNTKVAFERVDKPITHAKRDVKQLLQGCSFTKDQYDQILKMLDKRTEVSTSECNAANATGALQWEGEGSW